MSIVLNNIKTKLWVLLLTTAVLSFNIIAAEGKEISFHADDKFSNKLQTALKENHIFFKYQPYGYFTIDVKNAELFIFKALNISEKIFGSSNTPIPYDDMDIDRSGYMDKNGKIVIEPKYVIARPYDRYNIAAVADEIEWRYIDTAGKTILKPYLFDNGPDYFKDGLSRYVENNLIGFIDEKYQIVIKAKYEFVTPFRNNYATFCDGCKEVPLKEGSEHTKMEGGKWGLINKKGQVLVEAISDRPIIFEKHKAKVMLNGKPVYVDVLGNRKRQSNQTEDQMPEKLVQEILSIDRKAEDMAESVLKDPSLRTEFESESETLEDRLMYLADELERIDPAAYNTVADQVSESLLDLFFVQMENDTVSLRLGRIIEQKRLRGQDEAKDIFTEKTEPSVEPGMHTPKDTAQNNEALKEILDSSKGSD